MTSYKPPEILPEAMQVSLMVVDDLFMEIFGDHYIEPEVNYMQVWGVKPDVFKKNIKKNMKS